VCSCHGDEVDCIRLNQPFSIHIVPLMLRELPVSSRLVCIARTEEMKFPASCVLPFVTLLSGERLTLNNVT